mmetsp:Transcript_61931/g.130790  ORF Transcript_61931/g.130790 Transcript_61931/m.130790 type:complete len:426 (+) Transcript_61931:41-1318(+)
MASSRIGTQRDHLGTAESTTVVITKLDNLEAARREAERRLTERLASIQALLLTLTNCSLQELALSTAAAAAASSTSTSASAARSSYGCGTSTSSSNVLASNSIGQSNSLYANALGSPRGEERLAWRLQKVHQELGSLLQQETRRGTSENFGGGSALGGAAGLTHSLSFSLSNSVARHSSQASMSSSFMPAATGPASPPLVTGHQQQLQLLQAQLQQQLQHFPSLQQLQQHSTQQPGPMREMSKDIVETPTKESIHDQYARAIFQGASNSNSHSSNNNLTSLSKHLNHSTSNNNNNNSGANLNISNNINLSSRDFNSNTPSNCNSTPGLNISQASPIFDHQVTFAPTDDFSSERSPDGSGRLGGCLGHPPHAGNTERRGPGIGRHRFCQYECGLLGSGSTVPCRHSVSLATAAASGTCASRGDSQF